MHEIEEKVKKICELKDRLMTDVKPKIDMGVFCEGVEGEAAGEVVDMIKDLCQAEKYLWEACYYKHIVKGMKDAEKEMEIFSKMQNHMDMPENDRQGYDNWRYSSSGRFAPTGSGTYYGRSPINKGSMGYSDNTAVTTDSNKNRYGFAYDNWSDAKKYFTENRDPEARSNMEQYASKHLEDTLKTTREIWEDARPEMRREFKENMMKLLNSHPTT